MPVIDSFQFGGAVQVPAIVSYSMKWHASGPFVAAANGDFSGNFAPATVEGTFSGRELGFSFSGTGRVDPNPSAHLGYALIGTERNGRFL